MTITAATKPIPIVCSVCRIKIADAVPGALAKCPHCQTWSGTTERPRLPRRHSPPAQNPEVL